MSKMKTNYVSKAQVAFGMATMFVATLVAGIVAWFDPFGTGQPWLNWVALATAAIAGTFVAVAIAVYATEQPGSTPSRYLQAQGGWAACLAFFGGIMIGMVTTPVPAEQVDYSGLTWSGFAAFFVAYMVTALGAFMVIPEEDTRAYYRPITLPTMRVPVATTRRRR